MIELPNGKVARTQAEQVGFNSKKIEEIIKFLNESGLKDLVINLEAASGVLTDDQYAIAELSPSYIILSGKVYYKGYEDGTNIDFFEAVPEAAAATSLFLQVARIRIVEATKNYALSSVNIFESYNKSQIDSIISTVNDAINAKASLSGASFTGPITAPSITENMTGYSFNVDDQIKTWDYHFNYVGVVKTGNKITFVVSILVTKLADSTASPNIGAFIIPSSIGEKLIPVTLDGYTYLDLRIIQAFRGVATTVDCAVRIRKDSNTNIKFIMSSGNLVQNVQYLVRYEATFLLSDSLVS